MRLPNGYGGVVKLSGNRRRPYAARITTGWHINDETGKKIQHFQILGYAATRYTMDSQHFTYHNYYIHVFKPLVHRLGIDRTPHCCRHTTISLLADAHVDQTIIKKIVGHSGAMTLTERVYTHLDVHELVEAINRI